MQLIKSTIATLLWVMISLNAFSQERELPRVDENFQKYLEDGRKTGADGDIKFTVSSLVTGFAGLNYEQRINNNIALEGGVAFHVLKGFDVISDIAAPLGDELEGGFGFSLAGKYYGAGTAITDLAYTSLVFRNRSSDYNNVSIRTNDIYLAGGSKYLFLNSLSADLSFGMGMRMLEYEFTDVSGSTNANIFYAGIELKLGYYLSYN